MRYFLLLLSLILCFFCIQKEPTIDAVPIVEEKLPFQHPIPFSPENYICYQNATTLIIDGKVNEKAILSIVKM